jgi:hypothetical protein
MRDFLRRLAGKDPEAEEATGSEREPGEEATDAGAPSTRTSDVGEAAPADPDADERAYEREVLREENARLDELRQRQLRYAEYAWTPPPQGGERRADDEDASGERAGN